LPKIFQIILRGKLTFSRITRDLSFIDLKGRDKFIKKNSFKNTVKRDKYLHSMRDAYANTLSSLALNVS